MLADDRIFLGASRHKDDSLNKAEYLNLGYANRHGLVTGATGTGKTVSLQILAEGFSAAGVPVFAADIKGDLSGIALAGTAEGKEFLTARAEKIGFAEEYAFRDSPTIFWDLFGEQGHPVRTTVSEIGPLILSRLLDLTDVQEGVLNIAFKIADEEGLLLLDLKDLQSLLAHIAERSKEISGQYGNVSRASVGAIQRQLLVLEQQGGEEFFGEPALDIRDLMRTSHDGRGIVSVLAADKLMASPRLYATFLLWLLSELFEELPEVGDPDRPRLVFFFDEAHLLFDEAPKALVDKVEQVVKLIRSKGVGVYFVTQNPLDVPDSVLSQLGNRLQHALRADTPREAKAVKTAAETFRPNPEFETEEVITNLGVGEALVSTLAEKGVPSMVERTLIRPPSGRLGPITEAERQKVLAASPVHGLYDKPVDRQSAHEILKERAEARAAAEEEAEAAADETAARQKAGKTSASSSSSNGGGIVGSIIDGLFGRSGRRQSVVETAAKQAARTFAAELSRRLTRGVLGSVKRR
ncbi:helicase HerA-like domain-containing protein [Afifella pfennigii]|uniref:helicase HerA-like domain-containing protein n=1 Tax=Afifella pfennigii TaxID=209897 RepID=UPI00047AB0FE|nr:helicase HerA-like domain-containing protein [Afifella pfennigii]